MPVSAGIRVALRERRLQSIGGPPFIQTRDFRRASGVQPAALRNRIGYRRAPAVILKPRLKRHQTKSETSLHATINPRQPRAPTLIGQHILGTAPDGAVGFSDDARIIDGIAVGAAKKGKQGCSDLALRPSRAESSCAVRVNDAACRSTTWPESHIVAPRAPSPRARVANNSDRAGATTWLSSQVVQCFASNDPVLSVLFQ